MEKVAAASPKMILRFIPKVVSAVNFHNLTVSPGRLIPAAARRRPKNESQEEPTSPKTPHQVKKHASKLMRLFTGSKAGRGSNVSGGEKPKLPEKTPSLSQMKRFASGRDTLAGFDWTAHQIAPVEFDHSDYYSDEEKVDRFEEEEHEKVTIPFSAPMMVGWRG
ncbi:hypothetical protein OIU84_005093 [Salix udensis]|uniref:Uncharacterized protein n=1 Tax=Salix udensis TaxID=889485 RepID=A0AAD6P0C2_9ROSI|nr:hypothetical protein OIU84_005093 [Salix udensis]